MKLLIIEDERRLSDSIVAYLGNEKYLCEQAFDYDQAIEKAGMYDYDLIPSHSRSSHEWMNTLALGSAFMITF